MAEYIECEKYVKLNDIIETLEHEWGYEGMREDLYNLPTSDVVEVVRCKECKYFLHDTDYCKKHNAGYCEFDNQIKARLHFCGLAIKKEGAEEWLK